MPCDELLVCSSRLKRRSCVILPCGSLLLPEEASKKQHLRASSERLELVVSGQSWSRATRVTWCTGRLACHLPVSNACRVESGSSCHDPAVTQITPEDGSRSRCRLFSRLGLTPVSSSCLPRDRVTLAVQPGRVLWNQRDDLEFYPPNPVWGGGEEEGGKNRVYDETAVTWFCPDCKSRKELIYTAGRGKLSPPLRQDTSPPFDTLLINQCGQHIIFSFMRFVFEAHPAARHQGLTSHSGNVGRQRISFRNRVGSVAEAWNSLLWQLHRENEHWQESNKWSGCAWNRRSQHK